MDADIRARFATADCAALLAGEYDGWQDAGRPVEEALAGVILGGRAGRRREAGVGGGRHACAALRSC